MTITVTCECGAQFRAKDEHAGRRAHCPQCGRELTIPADPPDDDPADDQSFPVIQETPPLPAPPSSSKRRLPSSVGFNRITGIACLLSGLLLVLFARGCDALGNRATAAAAVKYQVAQSEFRYEWNDKKSDLEDELQDLRGRLGMGAPGRSDENLTPERRTQLMEDLQKKNEELADINAQELKARRKLERGDWRELQRNSEKKRASNVTAHYWREWMFLFGTAILTFGLVAIGFTGDGAERIVCLVLVGVMVFSVYIGGIAWIDSLVTSFSSTRAPVIR
jgi:hypothetical protein